MENSGKTRDKGSRDTGKRAEGASGSRTPETGVESSSKTPVKDGDYFQALVENAMDIVMIIDGDARIKYCNKAIEVLLGFTPQELLGENGLDYIHPEDVPGAARIVSRSLQDPDYSPKMQVRVRQKDGSYRHMEGYGRNYVSDPRIEGIVVSFRDIADRKQAEEALRESEELYRALVQTAPDAVTVSDLEGKIIYVSPKTLRLHGFKGEDELLGTSSLELIAPEDRKRSIANLQRTLMEGYIRNAEYHLVRKDGSRFIGELNAALIRDSEGKPRSFVAFTRDITERKKMERELQDRNEELEAFAYTISHDLLTPAAVVEGYAKAAMEADAEGRPEAERECLESIIRGARRMSDLIDSLLQYAQAGHMETEFEYVDPNQVLREILIDLEDLISARGAEVSVDDNMPDVALNYIKLHQVFFNLVGNALRHMGEMPNPRIVIGASRDEGFVVFHVSDNGVGIPHELAKKVFEPFKHYSISGSPGLGIGLSTVKRAVESWGGTVRLESEPGEGAAFYFTVPDH